jgi:hypothetical protein
LRQLEVLPALHDEPIEEIPGFCINFLGSQIYRVNWI